MGKTELAGRLARGFGALAFALTLAACGGGGGGDGGGGGAASAFSYSGQTSQATVTGGNAGDLAAGAYGTGDAGTTLAVVSSVVTSEQPSNPASVKAARVLKAAVARIDFNAAPRAVGALQHVASGPIFGTCGGSFNYSISVDDQTGLFSGSLVFNAYCEEPGESINGAVSFSGQIDLGASEFVSLQLTATNFTITSGSDSFAVSGTISYVFTSPSVMQVTENFDIQDASGLVYRVQDFVVTLTDTAGDTQIEISGRFYHPAHGYVEVATTTPFLIPFGSVVPTSGSLTATGAAVPGAGNGKATLTAIGGGRYQLQVDADGDGTFEQSSTGNWADL